jgi:hydrogenase maturation protein HypF
MARDGVELVAVQHHHAHLAACLAEHQRITHAVGAIFDGAGLGDDGTVWGGELLTGGLDSFERAGSLWPVPLPGGDRAAREPWRMACSWLQQAGAAPPESLVEAVGRERWEQVAALARSDLPLATTSAGRLFDAVASLCGGPLRVTYEGQAAIELEALCDPSEPGSYEMPLVGLPGGVVRLDARPTIAAIAADLRSGSDPARVATRFHRGLALATADACAAVASRRGLGTIVLSGGVFQNRRLLAETSVALERAGLEVLAPERLPANDGGVSFGQAAIAACWTAAPSAAASASAAAS